MLVTENRWSLLKDDLEKKSPNSTYNWLAIAKDIDDVNQRLKSLVLLINLTLLIHVIIASSES